MNYNFQIIKSIIVNLENRVLTYELGELYRSPNSWRKSVYRLCRKNLEKIDRERMSFDKFKIKNNTYFKEAEKGKWNRKISTLTASSFESMKDDLEDRIQKMILKLERKRLDDSPQVPSIIPLTRLVENFNRRKTEVTGDDWDIPIIHLVKRYNWRKK